jgi:hypothetical protein
MVQAGVALRVMPGYDKVVIVHALRSGREPGEIVRHEAGEVTGGLRHVWAHSIGLHTALAIGRGSPRARRPASAGDGIVGDCEVHVSTASIVVFAQHGAASLRETLHALRESAGHAHETVVLASDCDEQLAIYLNREYFRGNIAGYVLDHAAGDHAPCHVDRAFHLTGGDYLVRLDDALIFTQDWVAKVVEELDADPGIGWLSLLEPAPERRPRGRPRKPTGRPVAVDHADWRCYATRRDLLARHERACRGESGACCLVQQALRKSGKRIAHLPGLVEARPLDSVPAAPAVLAEDDLPVHGGEAGAMRRLRQPFELGDDVLMTCMACGATELEVLAARVKFCASHQVAIGHLYEFRCPECHELHYRDVLQLRCPDQS